MKNLFHVTYGFCICFVLMSKVVCAADFGCISGDCDALGYVSKVSDCSGEKVLCPFDVTKAFCAGVVYSDVDQIVYNDKVYYLKDAGISNATFAQAKSACEKLGYSLPENTAILYRVSSERSLMHWIDFDIRMKSEDGGIYGYHTLETTNCGSSQHKIAYLDGPKCVDDTSQFRKVICVKAKD